MMSPCSLHADIYEVVHDVKRRELCWRLARIAQPGAWAARPLPQTSPNSRLLLRPLSNLALPAPSRASRCAPGLLYLARELDGASPPELPACRGREHVALELPQTPSVSAAPAGAGIESKTARRSMANPIDSTSLHWLLSARRTTTLGPSEGTWKRTLRITTGSASSCPGNT